MQEEYISKLSEFPSVERVAQVKDVVDAVELKLRGGMLLMALWMEGYKRGMLSK